MLGIVLCVEDFGVVCSRGSEWAAIGKRPQGKACGTGVAEEGEGTRGAEGRK